MGETDRSKTCSAIAADAHDEDIHDMCGFIVVSAHYAYDKMYKGIESDLAEWFMSTV
jgi:hypothetical protein